MLAVLTLCSALAPLQPSSSRRAVLTHVAAASTLSVPFAASAVGAANDESGFIKDIARVAYGYAANPEGDAAIYTPKARIDGAGSKSSKLLMKMPDPGPLSAGDYVDVMFFKSQTGEVCVTRTLCKHEEPLLVPLAPSVFLLSPCIVCNAGARRVPIPRDRQELHRASRRHQGQVG